MLVLFMKLLGGRRWGLSPFFLFGILFFGCVPSPSETGNTPPAATDLHSYITPPNLGREYIWSFAGKNGLLPKDSTFRCEYIGAGGSKTFDGYSPTQLYNYSDFLGKDSSIYEMYVSDTLVNLYLGQASNPLTQRITLLKDTLRVGASWVASDKFRTSNGATVSIKALVEDYYALSEANYSNVYWVSYTATVGGSQIPIEPQFQNGAHISRYFAKGVGEYLEQCLDARDSLIWTAELKETRIR